MRICGIDPGVGGALALLDGGALARVADMPVTSATKANGGVRRRIDPEALRMVLAEWSPDLVVIEATWSSPGMGVASAYSFGHSAGVIEATVSLTVSRACGVRYVTPSAWKTGMGVSADKRATVAAATRLLGGEHWPLAKHHGRAEAALLALYGSRLEALRPAADQGAAR